MDLAEVTELTIDSLPRSRGSSFWASHSDKYVSILSGIGLENPVDNVFEIKIKAGFVVKSLLRSPSTPKLPCAQSFNKLMFLVR